MNGPTLRLAHRGDWRRARENTLPALLAALDVPGCDGLEFDVRASREGTPVLLHDPTLTRLYGRRERVDELDVDDLRPLGIPTLAEVLADVPSDVFLDVELKDDPGPGPAEVLAAGRGDGLANAVVSSFRAATLASVRATRPEWPCWLNADDLSPATIAEASRVGCRGVSVEWHAIDAPAVRRAADAGLEVAAWTVRDPVTFERLAALDVVAVCVEGDALDRRAGREE